MNEPIFMLLYGSKIFLMGPERTSRCAISSALSMSFELHVDNAVQKFLSILCKWRDSDVLIHGPSAVGCILHQFVRGCIALWDKEIITERSKSQRSEVSFSAREVARCYNAVSVRTESIYGSQDFSQDFVSGYLQCKPIIARHEIFHLAAGFEVEFL